MKSQKFRLAKVPKKQTECILYIYRLVLRGHYECYRIGYIKFIFYSYLLWLSHKLSHISLTYNHNMVIFRSRHKMGKCFLQSRFLLYNLTYYGWPTPHLNYSTRVRCSRWRTRRYRYMTIGWWLRWFTWEQTRAFTW